MKKIGKHPERISKTKPFINKYNWKGLNYPSGKDDWKILRKTIQQLLLMFYLYLKICPAHVSKHKSDHEKQIILLMIQNIRMALSYSQKAINIIRRKTSKNSGNFYCLNCLHSLRTKNKLESHKKVWENNDFCSFVMPSEEIKMYKSLINTENLISQYLLFMQILCP